MSKFNTVYVAVVFFPGFTFVHCDFLSPIAIPSCMFPMFYLNSVCAFHQLWYKACSCSSDQLFDRWHVLTSKLADIGWWLWLDGHRKLAICCNMLHRLRQGASAFKGIEWQDETFIKGLSICSHHIIFTLFQTLIRAYFKLPQTQQLC